MRVVLIDDEKPALEEMAYILGQYPDVEIAGQYQRAELALEELPDKKPDAIFVDIGLPSENGIRLVEKIREQNSHLKVIFVTAYPKYALEAYHVFPLDYVVKPVDEERFAKTMAYLREEVGASTQKGGRFQIRCFGRFRAFREEKNGEKKPIRFATRQARVLFLYLLTHSGRITPKSALTQVLFRETEPEKAANSLYVLVHSLRRSLEDISAARQEVCIRGKYWLDVPEGVCDYLDFVRFASQVDSPGFCIDEENIAKATQVSRLYAGELFGDETQNWLEPLRLQAEKRLERLLLSIAAFYFQSLKVHDCEKTLMQLLHVNPISFDGNSALLDLYIAIGNKENFQKHYEICAKTLCRELWTELAALYTSYYLSDK